MDQNKSFVTSITNTSHNYDGKYMNIKFHSDADLKNHNMVITVRSVFFMKVTIISTSFIR